MHLLTYCVIKGPEYSFMKCNRALESIMCVCVFLFLTVSAMCVCAFGPLVSPKEAAAMVLERSNEQSWDQAAGH